MQSGKVKSWDSQRGFGFIITEDDEELFVNVNDIHPSVQPRRLQEGQHVKFDVRSDMKGDRAVNVRVQR